MSPWLQEALGRAKSDFQRAVLQEWDRRNPRPLMIKATPPMPIVPTLCVCLKCRGDAIIIPDQEIIPARGFVLCPVCSVPATQAVAL